MAQDSRLHQGAREQRHFHLEPEWAVWDFPESFAFYVHPALES